LGESKSHTFSPELIDSMLLKYTVRQVRSHYICFQHEMLEEILLHNVCSAEQQALLKHCVYKSRAKCAPCHQGIARSQVAAGGHGTWIKSSNFRYGGGDNPPATAIGGNA
jgi:hypothetical protein